MADSYRESLETKNSEQAKEIERLNKWVNDLQSKMYINCVYCGHRYGPEDSVDASMQQVLFDHIAKCPKHPLSKCKAEINRLCECIEGWISIDEAIGSLSAKGRVVAMRLALKNSRLDDENN